MTSGKPPKAEKPKAPLLSEASDARKREREARQAAALRDNLRRRKQDLDSRSGQTQKPEEGT